VSVSGVISELIELSQERTTPSDFERGALALLEREVGFDVAMFSVRGGEESPTAIGLSPELVSLAVSRREVYGRELLPVKLAAFSARGVAVDTDVLGGSAVRRQRYFNELARRVRGRHSLLALVPFRGRVAAGILLGRTGSNFSRDEVRRLEDALPALGITRAVYGWPSLVEALPGPKETGPLSRLLGARRSRILASLETSSGTVTVRDRDGLREMVASSGSGAELVWTRVELDDATKSGWPYVDFFHLAAAAARQRRRALFIGAGGAVALRQFASVYPNIELDVVEREPAVIELARRWFDLGLIPNLRVWVEDGADFVERAAASRERRWDIAVIDAYDAEQIAKPVTQRRFFSALRRALDPGGAMALNLIAPLAAPSPLHALLRTLETEFPRWRVVPVVSAREDSLHAPRNLVVIAQAGRAK
jgi:predicted O-methyltransferase YrrM